MFSEIAHFSHLGNPYTPVGAGYLPQTFQTAEHGTTLRLPMLVQYKLSICSLPELPNTIVKGIISSVCSIENTRL